MKTNTLNHAGIFHLLPGAWFPNSGAWAYTHSAPGLRAAIFSIFNSAVSGALQFLAVLAALMAPQSIASIRAVLAGQRGITGAGLLSAPLTNPRPE